MSDEEKKAIDELKVLIGLEEFNKLSYKENQSIKTVINLIEKQQKEIEELKKQLDLDNECEIALNSKVMDLEKETEELKEGYKIQEHNYQVAMEEIEQRWQDKIKAKIKEYDDKGMTVNLANRSAGKTFQQAVHYEVKKVLQSLLEKE